MKWVSPRQPTKIDRPLRASPAEVHKQCKPHAPSSRALHRLPIGGLILIALGLFLSACGITPDVDLPVTLQPSAIPTQMVTEPTPEPPPPSTLIVCLRDEPETLYLYGMSNRETDLVLQALYDGPIDILGHQVQPVILAKVPSLEDGDARIESVLVTEGDTYLNPDTLLPDQLEGNTPYLPSGCTSSDCIRTYLSGDVYMDRMIVEFQLLDGIRWSDGEAVEASDSVFSFVVDSHKRTPSLKYLVDRTESYLGIDSRSVRWTGIPGFLDDEYQTNFWSPLPEHILGDYDARDLPELEEAAQNPVGWGAYVLDSWQPGMQIVMRKNELYFRAPEGLPAFEFLIFRFLGDVDQDTAVQQVLTGECDVLDESLVDINQLPRLVEMLEADDLAISWGTGPRVERLEFNLSPSDYTAPALFGDVRTRQAIAACIDRESIAQQLLVGFGQLADSYIPPSHPLHGQGSQSISYDPVLAASLLDQVGWVMDTTGTGVRLAQGVSGVRYGTPLTFTLLTTPGALHQTIGQMLQEDLAACGVQLEVEVRESQELFASW
ncbi:MAG: ABC transporter substrate-binding protein, partial [Anaerolineales bacterium]